MSHYATPPLPEQLQTLLREARAAHHQHRRQDAERSLDDALTLAQDSPALLLEVVSELWRHGQLVRARDVLRSLLDSLEASPYLLDGAQHTAALIRLGAAQIRLGNLSDALGVLYDALEMSDSGYAALQLGNALRYLGDTEEASGHLSRAFNRAKAERDGTLAIAALCAQGEVAIDAGEGQTAVERFGQGLGISEYARDEVLSVAPLAGLSHAHMVWGYPHKALEIGEKALQRAQDNDDAVGTARALLSLGIATGAATRCEQAIGAAQDAPHEPLRLKAFVAYLERSPAAQGHPTYFDDVSALATDLGMRPEQRRLAALAKDAR
ncbi:MAG: hypothetical protein U5L04_05005 [Trueperaceae bacterium]|nr:hypothetical protein [Trueperaceae bacterium]